MSTPGFQMFGITLFLLTPSRLHQIIANPTAGPTDMEKYLRETGFSDDAVDIAMKEYFGSPANSTKLDEPIPQGFITMLQTVQSRRELFSVLGVITQGVISFYSGPGFHPTNKLSGTPG